MHVTRVELEALIRPSLLRTVELLAGTIRATGLRIQDGLREVLNPAGLPFGEVLRTAQHYKVDMRTAAYIVAIDRVATVTRMRGMYA